MLCTVHNLSLVQTRFNLIYQHYSRSVNPSFPLLRGIFHTEEQD